MGRRPRQGTQRSFLKTVRESVKNMEDGGEAVYREGVLDFYIALRDATPVDTGNLRDAWVVSNAASPQPAFPTGPESGGVQSSGINESLSAIANIKIGDKVNILNRATYFLRLERGFTGYDSLGRFYNQPPRWFARTVGARYRSILRAAASRYKALIK